MDHGREGQFSGKRWLLAPQLDKRFQKFYTLAPPTMCKVRTYSVPRSRNARTTLWNMYTYTHRHTHTCVYTHTRIHTSPQMVSLNYLTDVINSLPHSGTSMGFSTNAPAGSRVIIEPILWKFLFHLLWTKHFCLPIVSFVESCLLYLLNIAWIHPSPPGPPSQSIPPFLPTQISKAFLPLSYLSPSLVRSPPILFPLCRQESILTPSSVRSPSCSQLFRDTYHV